jgi:hypothetical protein
MNVTNIATTCRPVKSTDSFECDAWPAHRRIGASSEFASAASRRQPEAPATSPSLMDRCSGWPDSETLSRLLTRSPVVALPLDGARRLVTCFRQLPAPALDRRPRHTELPRRLIERKAGDSQDAFHRDQGSRSSESSTLRPGPGRPARTRCGCVRPHYIAARARTVMARYQRQRSSHVFRTGDLSARGIAVGTQVSQQSRVPPYFHLSPNLLRADRTINRKARTTGPASYFPAQKSYRKLLTV